MNEINEILLRRKHKLTIEPMQESMLAGAREKAMIASIMKNIESLGFTFSSDVIEVLLTYSRLKLKAFYNDLIPKLQKLVGADVEYNPMYPNFPQQVAEMEDIELFFNAIIHYASGGELMPEYEKDVRIPLFDANKTVVLSLGQVTDVFEVFQNILTSKTAISPQDREDVEKIVENYPDFNKYLPEEIPLKENVALVAKIISDKAAIKNASAIQKYFKTATDVLRFITALSDGDISLATRTKYRSLRQYERRMVMDLLAGLNGDILEDLFRYHYQWIRVGEIVHPGEYFKKKYAGARQAFHALRNQPKPKFLPGLIQEAIKRRDMSTAAELLMYRPGDFARQLDKVIRDATDKNYVVNCFKKVAADVSTPVLLQVRQHFLKRNSGNPVRVFFPKGNLAKAITIKNELPVIEEKICNAVVKICNHALAENYMSREFMGTVYVDDDLKNYLVPFSQRSASSTGKTVVRGSSVPIKEDAETVRAFIWWTNTDNKDYWRDRVDIDLSAAIFDENWNYVEHVSYTCLRSSKMSAYHSGDIVDGGDHNGRGVAEFLDVNIDAVADNGRYIVYQVYSFTGQKFSELTNCRFGWMEREDVSSGEIFEPSTVEMSMDVNAESTIAIPVIFDCKERKFIWCDMNLDLDHARSRYGGNNVESNLSGVAATCYAMTHLNKTNLYDLIMLNVAARGVITLDRNQADLIFSNDMTVPMETVEVEDEDTGEKHLVQREKKDVKIINAFDLDYYMAQML